jgi:hypothetical protein
LIRQFAIGMEEKEKVTTYHNTLVKISISEFELLARKNYQEL